MQHDGIWWDPRNPDERWVGTLRIDESTGATLSLTAQASFSLEHPSLVLGISTDGTAITLIDAFEGSSFGDWSVRRVEVLANSVIVGFHADRDDPLITCASVAFEHLTEWWGHSHVDLDPAVRAPNLSVRYSAPPGQALFEEDGWHISLSPSFMSSVGPRRAHLEEKVRFEIRSDTPQPLSAFWHWIHACGDFLSLIVVTYPEVEEIELVSDAETAERLCRGTFHARPIYRGGRLDSVGVRCLLRFREIEPRASDVFGKWFAHARKLHHVRVLYMAGVYGGGFIETRLLALAQAAEAFHRRFYVGVYMVPADYEKVFAQMRAAIPTCVNASHREAISSRLRFANEISLRKRMDELFTEHTDALRVLVGNPSLWVGQLVDYRNALTHLPEPPPSPLDPDRVLRHNWILQMLLECCFLKVMGISADEIARVMRRSEFYRQISARFFTGASSGGVTWRTAAP